MNLMNKLATSSAAEIKYEWDFSPAPSVCVVEEREDGLEANLRDAIKHHIVIVESFSYLLEGVVCVQAIGDEQDERRKFVGTQQRMVPLDPMAAASSGRKGCKEYGLYIGQRGELTKVPMRLHPTEVVLACVEEQREFMCGASAWQARWAEQGRERILAKELGKSAPQTVQTRAIRVRIHSPGLHIWCFKARLGRLLSISAASQTQRPKSRSASPSASDAQGLVVRHLAKWTRNDTRNLGKSGRWRTGSRDCWPATSTCWLAGSV